MLKLSNNYSSGFLRSKSSRHWWRKVRRLKARLTSNILESVHPLFRTLNCKAILLCSLNQIICWRVRKGCWFALESPETKERSPSRQPLGNWVFSPVRSSFFPLGSIGGSMPFGVGNWKSSIPRTLARRRPELVKESEP